MSDEQLNESVLKLTRLLNENGDTVSGDFPIQVGADGRLRYADGAEKEEFLKRFGFSEELNAEEAFSKLRKYFKIKDTVSSREARDLLSDVYKRQISGIS